MNTGVIVGILLVIVLGAGALFIMQDQASDDGAMRENDATMDDGDAMTPNDGATGQMEEDHMGGDAMMEKDDETMAEGAGSFEAYAPEKLARAETGDVVLFFHAAWCPTCRALESDINANADSIPAGVTILKTDFDAEVALRQKYGVTNQHTLVQVDAAGNQIAKWLGSPTLASLISEIQ